jgi:hypothetical protein
MFICPWTLMLHWSLGFYSDWDFYHFSFLPPVLKCWVLDWITPPTFCRQQIMGLSASMFVWSNSYNKSFLISTDSVFLKNPNQYSVCVAYLMTGTLKVHSKCLLSWIPVQSQVSDIPQHSGMYMLCFGYGLSLKKIHIETWSPTYHDIVKW